MPNKRKPIEAFASILQAISRITKDPVILVGGHAVNVWAMDYKDRISEKLQIFFPLTSADIDVYATRNALIALHHELGGRLQVSGPCEITHGTLRLGGEADTLQLDVLRSLNGVSSVGMADTVAMEVCGHVVLVLFPHLLLQGKLANALDFDQCDRQDVMHIKVLALILREFLIDVVAKVTASNERPALDFLQETLAILTSEQAHRVSRKYRQSFKSIMPVDQLAATVRTRLHAFGEHQLSRASVP